LAGWPRRPAVPATSKRSAFAVSRLRAHGCPNPSRSANSQRPEFGLTAPAARTAALSAQLRRRIAGFTSRRCPSVHAVRRTLGSTLDWPCAAYCVISANAGHRAGLHLFGAHDLGRSVFLPFSRLGNAVLHGDPRFTSSDGAKYTTPLTRSAGLRRPAPCQRSSSDLLSPFLGREPRQSSDCPYPLPLSRRRRTSVEVRPGCAA
jgi:hypothetical protein